MPALGNQCQNSIVRHSVGIGELGNWLLGEKKNPYIWCQGILSKNGSLSLTFVRYTGWNIVNLE